MGFIKEFRITWGS